MYVLIALCSGVWVEEKKIISIIFRPPTGSAVYTPRLGRSAPEVFDEDDYIQSLPF